MQWGSCDWWQAYKQVGSRLWVCTHLVPSGLPTLRLVPCTHFRRPPRCVRCAVWRPRWASCCARQRRSTRRAATRCAWGWAEGTNRPRVSGIGEGLYGWLQEGRRAPSCIDAYRQFSSCHPVIPSDQPRPNSLSWQDVGGCGAPNAMYHFLQHPPRVFTLQLAWESHSEPPESIAATLAAVDEQVCLGGTGGGVFGCLGEWPACQRWKAGGSWWHT